MTREEATCATPIWISDGGLKEAHPAESQRASLAAERTAGVVAVTSHRLHESIDRHARSYTGKRRRRSASRTSRAAATSTRIGASAEDRRWSRGLKPARSAKRRGGRRPHTLVGGRRPPSQRRGRDSKQPRNRPKNSTFDARTTDNSEGSACEPAEDNAPVSASTPPPVPEVLDPDAALRGAIKAAVDAGDLARAAALLAILRGAPRAPEARV